ncbi:hypothetical protein Tmar_1487 [Thermaerobacter marianensis DSM 12885]|uniref:DUF2267 domain-containing protein n=1 Tax=Thermaerobacter marianensis (strain ATCC 700841 / DSM 12885 / JCM 10246 / 7p75a) TaxID=644966 RepID=E6SGE8_THEM7|nr:DUF2267 domain-containing protein [Thermaerobacter marianensis]ADU51600.1 hypothetical protein Tmar_1487 [Thermaerobacter marianensis DSM 12885]
MRAREIYQEVQQRGRLGSLEEAATVTRMTLQSLAEVLGRQAAEALAAALPPELAAELGRAPDRPDPLIDREVFVGRLVNHMDTEYGYDQTVGGLDLVSAYMDDDAATRMQAVFAALKGHLDEGTRQAVRRALPPEIRHWWDGA